MADTAPAPSTPKKGKAAGKEKKAKKPKTTPNHPVVSVMVNAAITNLKERGGSSLQAVKKYISSNYKVDADRLAPFIRKYIKKAVAEGKLVQTKGTGASGSFKMSSDADKSTKKTSAKKVGAKKAAKPKKTPTKKARTPKPKKSPAKKPKAAKPKKSPAKKPKATGRKAKSPKKSKK